MKALSAIWLLVCISVLATGFDDSLVQGAWLQDGVKWTKAPPDINSQLQAGEAEILYFGKDQTFAVIYCVVNRIPKQYETISHGDGQVVYRGKWQAVGESFAVEYRLVSRTVKIGGEVLPGPIQEATIKAPHSILSFWKKDLPSNSGTRQ